MECETPRVTEAFCFVRSHIMGEDVHRNCAHTGLLGTPRQADLRTCCAINALNVGLMLLVRNIINAC